MSGSKRKPSARSFLSLSCLLGYWILGHGFGDFYPISPLGMFRDKLTSTSRILARPVDGTPIEILYYVDWHCEAPLDFSNEAHPTCPKAEYSAYDSIVTDYILAHPGSKEAGEPVDILRRQFTIAEPGGPLIVDDCPLLRCTARRRVPPVWMPRL